MQAPIRFCHAAWCFALLVCPVALLAQSNVPERVGDRSVPTFKDVIGMRSAGSPQISPDGGAIVYTLGSSEWDENRYDTEIWLARDGEEPFQLTRTAEGSSTAPRWSPDGTRIAFLADRGDKRQVHLIRLSGGEAWPLTAAEDGVSSFRWSPDGTRIAYSAVDPSSDDHDAREKTFGKFAIEDNEYRMTHLWLVETSDDDVEAKRLTQGQEFTVGSFEFSPDGGRIAFDHQPDPLINSSVNGDISILDVETSEITTLVERPGPDGRPSWSPDGKSILFGTTQGDLDSFFYLNRRLAIVPAAGGEPRTVSEAFDEHPSAAAWTTAGVYFLGTQKTQRHLYRLAPDSGEVNLMEDLPELVWAFDIADDGRSMALLAERPGELREVYRTSGGSQADKVTSLGEQVEGWALGTAEMIEWSSLDGAQIEGVLYKPDNYQSGEARPLMVVIHGGPTGTSRPRLVNQYVYPIAHWLAKGAVVLMPNYRGSGGYGEAFRSLNVRNLGVGDMWDVMSGVEHLVDTGVADPDRMGAMGWSQGGYISAFLTTNTDRFRAISVGAGISNWMTYYVNTDIHPFTRQYLKATPWDDPNIYAKTSPMTNIRNASTPTLIQHGEFDRRVPIPNAYELYQGLRDNDVDARLVVYKGFGHGINKPKELLAAVWHNWQWFAKYIWQEDVEIPVEVPDADEENDDDEE